MACLEKAENLARQNAANLDVVSRATIATAVIGVVYEAAKRHPKNAAMVGTLGLLSAAGLKASSALYEIAADKISFRKEHFEDSNRLF